MVAFGPMPPDAFSNATRVTPVDGPPTVTPVDGPPTARWAAEVADGWDIVGNTNGGYLLAIVARAMSLACERPDPVTVTGHYLSPARPGPATVDTTLVRSGRRFATATGLLTAAGKPVLSVLGTFGDLAADAAAPGGAPPELVTARHPDLPPVDDCVAVDPGGPGELFPPPFMGRIELRLHPDDAAFGGRPSGDPRIRGWFRLRDDEPVTTLALLCAVDAFPPTVFNANLPIAWTPTVELTAHVRARPAPGWLACQFSTRFITAGFLEADGEVWDATGQLVAQSRQLALVPRG